MSSAAIGYDNRGNVTSDAARGQSYQWDLDGRLSGVDTDASGTVDVTLQYDALGRRVRKGNWIYAYAGDQVVAEYSSPSQPVSTPSIRFVYGAYVDEPIVKYNSSDVPFWYHRNHQYSIVAMSNSGGSVSERYGYDPHGRMTILAGNGTTVRSVPAYSSRFTYTGRRWDEDLNVYDFRARMYDAQLGRFLSRDPLGYVDGMNVYRGYFAVQGLDPWGMDIVVPSDLTSGCSAIPVPSLEEMLAEIRYEEARERLRKERAAQLDAKLANCGTFDWWSTTKCYVGAALDGFFVDGPYNVAKTLGETGKEISYCARDCCAEVVCSDKPTYWSATGKAVSSGQLECGDYYADAGTNILTFGCKAQVDTLQEWANGEISWDEASGRLGTTACFQFAVVRSARFCQARARVRFIRNTRLEARALQQQGICNSEAFVLMRRFNCGESEGFFFHFTTPKGARGILNDGV